MGRFTVKKPMIKEKQTTVTGRRIEKLKESTSCGKRIWVRRTVMATIFLILILAAYRLNTMKKTELVTRTGNTYEKGVVQKVLQDNLQADGTRSGEQVVTVKMTTGVRKGEVIQMTSASGFLFGTACTPGLHVIVVQSVSGDSTVSSVYSRDRGGMILLFGLLYLAILIAVGGRQGLKASAGLIITFFIIIFIWIPLIYLRVSPIRSAVVICALTTILTFWCIGGISRKTITATLGTVSGVVIAGIFAEIFSLVTGTSGWNVSNIETLLTIWESNRIKVGGLLFAGILISALGAEMDVAMSISSSMQEVCRQNPGISRWELFCAGMRVGRDMMGTDSNTLLLAFVGTEVSQLVLNFAYDLPAAQVLNSNNIGIAVMQGLSGSFGIVLSVPITVLIASWIFRGKPSESTERILQ
ncbi:YibE/F family protein [Porcincola intestinalis]|uniref:YibE/F family protein n=1 Tax=Porcincola intestinalis TaxID=2606632 RepID=UPI0023F3601D|nr:YibE/F family protein [Porcincola intestinalis]MCI6767668.1 YibE/F family protein [Lachnospiraceae bacterium]MDD7060470.1 YibE/F family protein [Porcincola intestinalis]MDY5282490.1 YibE/F family protein [Porcincola intestinalis]